LRVRLALERGNREQAIGNREQLWIEPLQEFKLVWWFAKIRADFEINDMAALPPLFCHNS
jgi:hypothetical protein